MNFRQKKKKKQKKYTQKKKNGLRRNGYNSHKTFYANAMVLYRPE